MSEKECWREEGVEGELERGRSKPLRDIGKAVSNERDMRVGGCKETVSDTEEEDK